MQKVFGCEYGGLLSPKRYTEIVLHVFYNKVIFGNIISGIQQGTKGKPTHVSNHVSSR